MSIYGVHPFKLGCFPSTQTTQSRAKEVGIGRVMLHFRNRFCVLIETVCIEDSEHKFDERFAFDP